MDKTNTKAPLIPTIPKEKHEWLCLTFDIKIMSKYFKKYATHFPVKSEF